MLNGPPTAHRGGPGGGGRLAARSDLDSGHIDTLVCCVAGAPSHAFPEPQCFR